MIHILLKFILFSQLDETRSCINSFQGEKFQTWGLRNLVVDHFVMRPVLWSGIIFDTFLLEGFQGFGLYIWQFLGVHLSVETPVSYLYGFVDWWLMFCHVTFFLILQRLFEEKFRLLLGVVRPRGGRRRLRRLFQTVPGAGCRGCGCEAAMFFPEDVFLRGPGALATRAVWVHGAHLRGRKWRRDETSKRSKKIWKMQTLKEHSELWSLWWIWVAEGFWRSYILVFEDLHGWICDTNIDTKNGCSWMWIFGDSQHRFCGSIDVNWVNQDEELANLTFEYNAEISGYNPSNRRTLLVSVSENTEYTSWLRFQFLTKVLPMRFGSGAGSPGSSGSVSVCLKLFQLLCGLRC